MPKASKPTPSQCQLFPSKPTDLPELANVSPRLMHLLVKLLRNAAGHNESRLPRQDAGHE
jgi:hypothetical protein